MSLALAVALGAAAGAPARYLLDAAVSSRSRSRSRLPLGILAVNLLGCLAAGVLAGAEPSSTTVRLVGLGFLGSFTTASTLAWDVIAVGARSRRAGAVLLALHVVGGLALAAVGLTATRGLV